MVLTCWKWPWINEALGSIPVNAQHLNWIHLIILIDWLRFCCQRDWIPLGKFLKRFSCGYFLRIEWFLLAKNDRWTNEAPDSIPATSQHFNWINLIILIDQLRFCCLRGWIHAEIFFLKDSCVIVSQILVLLESIIDVCSVIDLFEPIPAAVQLAAQPRILIWFSRNVQALLKATVLNCHRLINQD